MKSVVMLIKQENHVCVPTTSFINYWIFRTVRRYFYLRPVIHSSHIWRLTTGTALTFLKKTISYRSNLLRMAQG